MMSLALLQSFPKNKLERPVWSSMFRLTSLCTQDYKSYLEHPHLAAQIIQMVVLTTLESLVGYVGQQVPKIEGAQRHHSLP